MSSFPKPIDPGDAAQPDAYCAVQWECECGTLLGVAGQWASKGPEVPDNSTLLCHQCERSYHYHLGEGWLLDHDHVEGASRSHGKLLSDPDFFQYADTELEYRGVSYGLTNTVPWANVLDVSVSLDSIGRPAIYIRTALNGTRNTLQFSYEEVSEMERAHQEVLESWRGWLRRKDRSHA